jgi:hypothetical protein
LIIAPAISGKPRIDPLSHAPDGPKLSGAASHLGRGKKLSIEATTWACSQKTSNKLAKLTLILMCDCCDPETDLCTFLVERIADDAQVSAGKIFSHLKSLEKDGLIAPWPGVLAYPVAGYARYFLWRKLSK